MGDAFMLLSDMEYEKLIMYVKKHSVKKENSRLQGINLNEISNNFYSLREMQTLAMLATFW